MNIKAEQINKDRKPERDLVVKNWAPPKNWLITKEEFRKYSRDLEMHHAIFYRLWEMGIPVPDMRLETAAVLYDQTGEVINFVFNPEFWRKHDEYTRTFILAHEMLHVVLHHGYRSAFLNNKQVANVALDIVVNESLVAGFGFDRNRVQGWKKLCWVDTVFKDDPTTPKNQTFEYYYQKLLQQIQEQSGKGKGKRTSGEGKNKNGEGADGQSDEPEFVILDSHEHSFDKSNTPKNAKTIEKLGQEMRHDEVETIRDAIDKHDAESKQAGTSPLGAWHFVAADKPVIKKKKWETVIKKWALASLRTVEKDVEQWARTPRRMINLPESLMLPTEMPSDVQEDKARIEVWFFIDASGSCIGMKDRFFKAARSLPPERFQVRLFSFDTEIYELQLKNPRVRGGGGTSFRIIESYIQKHMETYPRAVFVLTDGYGDQVKPEKPRNWYWFLSEDVKDCFPNDCNSYMLSDFE